VRTPTEWREVEVFFATGIESSSTRLAVYIASLRLASGFFFRRLTRAWSKSARVKKFESENERTEVSVSESSCSTTTSLSLDPEMQI